MAADVAMMNEPRSRAVRNAIVACGSNSSKQSGRKFVSRRSVHVRFGSALQVMPRDSVFDNQVGSFCMFDIVMLVYGIEGLSSVA